jgi:DNA-binding CsgD family transcriptional regulator
VDVARLFAQRKRNTEIAGLLGVSLHTARHHSEHVLDKLDIDSRTRVQQVLEGE